MSLEDEARELDARDAAAELDAAREQLEENRRQWKIRWWVENCGMPTGLSWEEAQAWAAERQRQSDRWHAAWDGWKRRVYEEINLRSRRRMLAAGFTLEELEPIGYMPQEVEPTDPRNDAFEAAYRELLDDQRALEFIFGGTTADEVGESQDSSEHAAAGNSSQGPETAEMVSPNDVEKELKAQDAGPLSHSPDFRSIRWFGTFYSFTPKQAPVVRALWEAWERGCPEVGGATLLESVDRDDPPGRVNTLFRNHKCWNVAIVPGATRGTYRLKPPAAAE